MPRLKVSLLGPFQASLDGDAVTGFESNKVRALLAYLAAEAGQPARREALAELLWPNWPEKSALRNLTFALADLRKNIADREAQPPFLLIDRDSLQLNRESDVWVDLWEFEAAVKEQGIREMGQGVRDQGIAISDPQSSIPNLQSKIANLQSALSLYRGPFLEGFSLPDNAPLEEWLSIWREKVKRQVLQTLGELALCYEKQGEYDQALSYTRRQVELEPWLEEAHQQLMRLLALNGQRSAALAQYETLRKVLQAELGVDAGADTVALYEQIRDGKLGRYLPIPDAYSPSVTKPRPKPNLPLQLTHFFGREEEVALVKEKLADRRLVTLTGSGGVGKTRLALRVAEETQGDYPDGVWLIELAPLSDPELVPQQIAVTLGLREDPASPILDTLEGFLQNKAILLVLDNCEHLLESCASLAESLLQACPGLKILASSREPLGLAGETIYRVPSLPFPERGQAFSPESMESYASVGLFVDRARQVLPGYQVTAQNAASLATICQRLDGIPLALELAAARMSLLTAEELSSRLDKAFRVLSSGKRSVLPRQQTLRATIDWSYKLLSEKERLLFHRLAGFAGEWDLQGAEGVCAGDGLEQDETLDLLAALVNKSMVIALRSQGRPARYRMLETIRQYAREKLVDSGEMEVVRRRHLAYFLALAETAEPEMRGPNFVEGLRRLADDLENLRLALEVDLEADPQAGLRLASALWQFWYNINRPVEGIHWLGTYLHMPENAVRNAIRGYALSRLCLITRFDLASEGLARESLEIFHELDDLAGQGMAQFVWGGSLLGHEDYSAARVHYEAALEIFEKTQSRPWLAAVYANLSDVAFLAGDIAVQVAFMEKCVALNRELGNLSALSWNLDWLKYAVVNQGDFQRGRALTEEIRSVSRKIDPDNNPAGDDQDFLAWQGEYLLAEQFVEKRLERARQSDDEAEVLTCYFLKGRLDCFLGRLETGSALIEQSMKIFKESNRLRHLLNINQTFIMELAYALGCLGEVERARSLVQEYWPIFQAPSYQPMLMKLLGFLAWQEGENQDALRYYRRSLQHAHQMGHRLFALQALEGYAWALQQDSQPSQAAVRLGAASEFRQRIGSPVFPRDRPMQEKVIAALKDSLGEEEFARAWAEGQALGFDQAIADALGDI